MTRVVLDLDMDNRTYVASSEEYLQLQVLIIG